MLIGFAGTPEFAASILNLLLASKHEVALVLTQPGRPAGRGRKIRAGPVETLARAHGVEIHTPTRLAGFEPALNSIDLLVVAAYGLLLPKSILNAPRAGCLNVHASLLPRWRGASPVEHAILHGDEETGVSIVQMTSRLDAGPIYRKAAIPLTPESTTTSVTAALADLGGTELAATLDQLECGTAGSPHQQSEAEATYAPRLENAAARIDWCKITTDVDRHIRAFHGRGMAFSLLAHKSQQVRVRILEAIFAEGQGTPGHIVSVAREPVVACGDGAMALKSIQMNIGKGRPMSGTDAVNGYSDIWQVGGRFETLASAEHA